MNTSAGYYQAPRPPRVPLDEVLIKLHPEGFHQTFEADGINVGAGGLSMRASVLPQVGSTLRCQLDNPAGSEAIEMIGRVVWAHETGEHAGEFGIRFTHLSSQDQVRIEALIQRWGRRSAQAPSVRLQLDGIDSAIVAELKSENEDVLTVEQPLPFLSIGSSLLNETTGRRGHLEAVELRMEEHTPRLVLSIGYSTVDDPVEGQDASRDTLPDDPPIIRASQPAEESRLHDTPTIVRYDRSAEAAPQSTITDRLRAQAGATREWITSSVKGARIAVTARFLPAFYQHVKELLALLGRFIGALRARLDEKPRRKQVPRSQAARAHLKNTRRSHRKAILLAAMVAGIGASGLGIYLWMGEAAVETVAPVTAAEEVERPAKEAAPPKQRMKPAPASAATKEPAPAPHGAGAPVRPEKVRGASFGAKSVPGGEAYVLRMSNPVTEMEGIVEQDGFSVTIPGSLSLSRAGPIAAAHPDIEHASILNRGEFSELTVRFVAGRTPPYRVESRGPAIVVTVAR